MGSGYLFFVVGVLDTFLWYALEVLNLLFLILGVYFKEIVCYEYDDFDSRKLILVLFIILEYRERG